MKKYIIIIVAFISCYAATAQDNISPAANYKGITFIKNGTVHTGTGAVLANTSVLINNGKIEKIGTDVTAPSGDVRVVDATGMQV